MRSRVGSSWRRLDRVADEPAGKDCAKPQYDRKDRGDLRACAVTTFRRATRPTSAPGGRGASGKVLPRIQSEKPAKMISTILIRKAGVTSSRRGSARNSKVPEMRIHDKAEPGKPEQLVEARQRKLLRISEHAGAEHERYADHHAHADGMKAEQDRLAPIGFTQPNRKVRRFEPCQQFHCDRAFASIAAVRLPA